MSHYPARGLYDQLEDTLTSITKQLCSAIQADAATPPGVNGVSDPLHRAAGWARRMSSELGSVLLDTLGLAATIEWHVRQFQKCTGIACDLTVNNTAGFELPGDCAAAIYDIYNGALSNAPHAGASRVAIVLAITPREVALVVSDNGAGFTDQAPLTGTAGLAAIRARARARGGFCEVACARNAGTTVTVRLPVV